MVCCRCLGATSVEGGLCHPCIVALATISVEAYDHVRLDAHLPDRLILEAVEAFVGSQHVEHTRPRHGCPFCVPA